ncbi:MAG: hypothetical protein NC548_15575 [Lachnospiraceae bacterium]|nr:hypothetical protein [Lachnospiraceae bacterium]
MMQSIVTINNDINSWYRSSKFPKWLKKLIAKRKRKKLKKSINKFSDKILTARDVLWILNYCLNTYHGDYMYLKTVIFSEDYNPLTIFGVLKYEDEESGNIYQYSIDLNYKQMFMNIKITIENEKGKKNFNIEGIKDFDTSNTHNEIIAYLINALNSMISEMVTTILNDITERSERIYEI